jgi:hypothetical protein
MLNLSLKWKNDHDQVLALPLSDEEVAEFVQEYLELAADDMEKNEPYAKNAIRALREAAATVNC